MTEQSLRTNAPLPGSGGAGANVGMVESVKRAVIVGLRDAISGTTLNGLVNGDRLTIEMEYPLVEEKYPGIWVQFSFTKIQNSGVGWELMQEVITSDEDGEHKNYEPVREFTFEGRVTLTIVALTSLERDRISDAVLTMLLFSRPPETEVIDRGTKQFRQLLTSLAENPYVSMSVNTDVVTPGGQAVTTGVPWDSEILGYEDSYSFDILGQTNIVFRHDGSYILRRIDIKPEKIIPSRYDWQ